MKWFIPFFIGVVIRAQWVPTLIDQVDKEAGRLINLGTIKVIVDYSEVEFLIDLRELKNEHDNLKSKILERRQNCEDETCAERMMKILDYLLPEQRLLESWINPQAEKKHSRSKRWDELGSHLKRFTGVLDANDGRQFEAEIGSIREKEQQLEEKVDAIREKPIDTDDDILLQVEKFTNKMLKIVSTYLLGSFDGVNVQLNDFLEKIESIKASLDEKLELACEPLECILIPVETEIGTKFIKYTMKIPIVQTANFTLYKVLRTPFKIDNFVAVLNFSSHFAFSDDSDKVFSLTNLNSCKRRLNNDYLCEASETRLENCLSTVASNQTVDMELCMNHILIAQLPGAVMIENDAGDFWYNFDGPKVFNRLCNGTNESFEVRGGGLMKEDKLCSLFTADDKEHEIVSSIKERCSCSKAWQVVILQYGRVHKRSWKSRQRALHAGKEVRANT